MRNEKLITAREEREWTQEKAAEKIGVSRVTYARWEEKGVIPHLSTLGMACKAFKMTSEQLGFRKPSGFAEGCFRTVSSRGTTLARLTLAHKSNIALCCCKRTGFTGRDVISCGYVSTR